MPADDHKTSYSPGDLYDLLSSSPETRFHAGYLFVRYLLHVRSASTLASLPQTGGKSPEDQEALEAVTWDVAVACLALSIKFHRDVLFPLDVIYVHEFLDLAPHEMEFEDLENAQRDVLEAVAFRVGSATPGAFIEELWDALTPLRRLVSFDGRWEAVQEEAWEILNDALQQPELLQYPPSLITGAAVIEAVVEVLQRSYKTAGVDGRGKPVGKRDARSLRKVALKCSRGVRLDIQDILQISNVSLSRVRTITRR
ncbi:hypothetical protein L226DRAFT_469913 [Lentinus tigrinus ALCF2SS1-7]|uniref:uncharacterized protein n=1 Tax=Lentinus tigrinus ALCF2SS1-7 TaxID=1328758 RepID=UPI001165E887|nr:hypothetical protein L226DRAFT_469913 [Lentinus tigrinus ALCF2SS1-7]